MSKFQSGLGIVFFYNLIPIVSNAIVLTVLNVVIGKLLYSAEHFALFRRVILDNPLHNFLGNILPFPLVMGTLAILHYPAFRIFSREKSDPRYELGLRRMADAPFYIGASSFFGWLLGTLIGQTIYKVSGVELSAIVILRVMGVSVVAGILSFVMNYYLISLVNRRYFIPLFFPEGGGLQRVAGIMRFTLRFNLDIFLLAVATGPILLLGLALLNMQGMVPSDNRPSYALSIGLILGLIALGLFMSMLLARSLSGPLSRMCNAAEAIENGDYSVKLPVDTTDEIGDLAQSINKMALGLSEKEKIKDSFGRAVDPRVRDYLLERGFELGGEHVEATILFSDIRGFTSFSESHSPPEVVQWLNAYFERMALCVREYGGIVNKYIGDAMLVVFNTPLPLENHAQAAFACALSMLVSLDELNQELRAQNTPEIRIGIGIHTGPVVAGNIGSHDRQEFTVIGDTVNTASRIEGLCKKLHVPLLVSESIFNSVEQTGARPLKKLGVARVKGKSTNLTVYGLATVSKMGAIF